MGVSVINRVSVGNIADLSVGVSALGLVSEKVNVGMRVEVGVGIGFDGGFRYQELLVCVV